MHNHDALSSVPVMRTPRSVDLEITSRCNQRCRYCYFFDNPEVSYSELPTASWLEFIGELGRCNVMDVCLAGGEPFMRKDLRELIAAIAENRMRFSILSNGSLVDAEIAEYIRATNRCDYVQVSIDGSCAEIHDTCRGKGSFALAVQGLKMLLEHEIPATVRITLHRYNIHDLENTARFLLEELGIEHISTNSAGYFGSCRQNSADLQLSVADRQLAMTTLLKLEQKYDGRVTAQAGPLAEAHYWTSMDKAFRSASPGFDNGGYLTGCGCTRSKIAVRSDGMMVPCTMLSGVVLGRINTDPLQKVWQENCELNAIRQRNSIPLSSFKTCRDCNYCSYCTGNCPGHAYNLTGDVNRPSPDGCLQEYLSGGGSLPAG